MKLFIQDHRWAGATIVIAEDENQAASIASEKSDYYEKDRPWDHIQDCDKPFHTEIFGDR